MRDLVKETLKRILEAEEREVGEELYDVRLKVEADVDEALKQKIISAVENLGVEVTGSYASGDDVRLKVAVSGYSEEQVKQKIVDVVKDLGVKVIGSYVSASVGEDSELQIYSTEPSGAMGEQEPEMGRRGRVTPSDIRKARELLHEIWSMATEADMIQLAGDALVLLGEEPTGKRLGPEPPVGSKVETPVGGETEEM